MALYMNTNLPAMKAARYLGGAYNSLSKSIERLSSGLRINSAADDAAGLAVRELMRADIAAGYQGIRNAADGVSLIQTADGALGVINDKLIKMKELAMQAASDNISGAEREMVNSEYQAMATDIDRIANAAVFNGVRLLDGSMNLLNNGQGLKIHFGTGNRQDVDYYYINTQDTRATSTTGLRIGGDGKNDIWANGSYGSSNGSCCGGNISSLSAVAVLNSGRTFGYAYNWDGKANTSSADLLSSRYLGGRYGFESGMTYEQLIDQVNRGTQSRVGVQITGALDAASGAGTYLALCLDTDEVYHIGSGDLVPLNTKAGKVVVQINNDNKSASGFARAINTNEDSKYWAFVSSDTLFIFRRDGGDNNNLSIEINGLATDIPKVDFINVATGARTNGTGQFSMGGEDWGATMKVEELRAGGYTLALLGKDVGDDMDLYITGGAGTAGTGFNTKLVGATDTNIEILGRDSFFEVQDAADGPWVGAEIRTTEAAARAMGVISAAIFHKDQIRASLAAMQEQLETVIQTQTIHMENLQAAEGRISDVDVATEMTEFTKQNILAQAATAMLSQANSMANLALSLILG